MRERPTPEGEHHEEAEQKEKSVAEIQKELRSRLFDLDDLLKDAPADFPERETIRSLLATAGTLNNPDPIGSAEHRRQSALERARSKLSPALEALDLDGQRQK